MRHQFVYPKVTPVVRSAASAHAPLATPRPEPRPPHRAA